MITENGRKLFHEIAKHQEQNLIPPFGRNSEDIIDIIDICSRLSRAAKTYERIQEKWCNDEMSESAVKRLENEESMIERNIRRLAGELNCGFIVKFEGDPRGHCVRLHYSPRRASRNEEDYIGVDI